MEIASAVTAAIDLFEILAVAFMCLQAVRFPCVDIRTNQTTNMKTHFQVSNQKLDFVFKLENQKHVSMYLFLDQPNNFFFFEILIYIQASFYCGKCTNNSLSQTTTN